MRRFTMWLSPRKPPYAPVLFESACMSWMETDAAQSINVGQVTNI